MSEGYSLPVIRFLGVVEGAQSSAHRMSSSKLCPRLKLRDISLRYTVQPAYTEQFGAAKTVPFIQKTI